MANSYYNNSLVDGDTMSETTLEAIEDGFDDVETDIGGKISQVSSPTVGHVATLDASGNVVDSGTYYSRRRAYFGMSI